MTILLPAIAVAFAASCVWLTMRIVNRRARWANWTLAAAVSLPVIYVGIVFWNHNPTDPPAPTPSR